MTVFWALLSGLAFAVGDTTVRMGVRTATPYTGALLNSAAMILSLGTLLWIRGLGPGPLWPAVGWFFLVGAAANAPGRLLFYTNVQRIGVARSSVLNSITPFLGILIGVLFLGERPTWHIPVGAAFIVGGILGLLTGRAAGRIAAADALSGIVPAFFFSLTPVFMRLGMQSLPDPILGSVVASGAAIVVLLGGQGLVPRKSRWGTDRRAFWIFLGAGLVYASAFLAFYKALDAGTVSFVAPLIYTSPLFSILISRLLIQNLEQINRRLVLGAITVFIGVALVALSRG